MTMFVLCRVVSASRGPASDALQYAVSSTQPDVSTAPGQVSLATLGFYTYRCCTAVLPTILTSASFLPGWIMVIATVTQRSNMCTIPHTYIDLNATTFCCTYTCSSTPQHADFRRHGQQELCRSRQELSRQVKAASHLHKVI